MMQHEGRLDGEWYGTLLASLSAILLGFVGFFGTKLLNDQFTIPNMLFWRFSIAAAGMIAFTILSRKSLVCHIDIKLCLFKLVTIAILYSTASALYFVSAKLLGTGLAVAIFFSFPVFVTAFAFLFDSFAIDRYTIIALMAICFGIILTHNQHAAHANWNGVLLSLLCAFFYASYVYRSRSIGKMISPVFLTMLVCIGDTIIFFIFTYVTGEFALPQSSQEWLLVTALGIIGTALPIQLLLESLKYISPVKASIMASLQVVITILMGWLLLHEHIDLLQLCGVMVILIGAIVIQKDR